MTRPGSIALARLLQAEQGAKLRPVLVLSVLPGRFSDLLVCGISSQLRQAIPEWDEVLVPDEARFQSTGLRVASVIRLSHLGALPQSEIAGALGELDQDTLYRLLGRLAHHLTSK